MNALIKHNWFIAIAAFSQCLAVLLLFDKVTQHNLFYAMSVGFGTKVIYSVLRAGKNMLHKPRRNQIIKQESPWFILSIAFFILSNPLDANISIIALAALLAGVYAAHIREQQHYPVLRKNAIAKVIIITFVWVSITVFYPLNVTLNSTINQKWLFLLMQFFFVAMLTIPFDFRDAASELEKGFSTLPAKYGELATKKICRALAILTWICSGFLGLPYLLIMSVLALIYLRSLNSITKEWSFEKYTIHFDGLLILQAVAFIAFSLFQSV